MEAKIRIKAIVTGSSSFIGSALVNKLLQRGYEVFAFSHSDFVHSHSFPIHDSLHKICCDLKDIPKKTEHLPCCDVFFHFAWQGEGALGRSDPGIQAKNVLGAIDCLEAAAKNGCKQFVFAGSQAEYGPYSGVYSEDTPLIPLIEYGKAKAEVWRQASKRALELDIHYIHVRIFSIYGPGDHPWTLISDCIDKFSRGEDMILSSCEQFWNYLYVTDAVDAFIALSETQNNKSSNVYNLASEDTRPLKEFVKEIVHLTNSQSKALYGKLKKATEPPVSLIPDISKLLNEIDWYPKVTFKNGILNILATL